MLHQYAYTDWLPLREQPRTLLPAAWHVGSLGQIWCWVVCFLLPHHTDLPGTAACLLPRFCPKQRTVARTCFPLPGSAGGVRVRVVSDGWRANIGRRHLLSRYNTYCRCGATSGCAYGGSALPAILLTVATHHTPTIATLWFGSTMFTGVLDAYRHVRMPPGTKRASPVFFFLDGRVLCDRLNRLQALFT